MKKGEFVSVKAYGGEILTRRVVADLGRIVVICSEAEYQRAKAEKREPEGVGFPAEDVSKRMAKKIQRNRQPGA